MVTVVGPDTVTGTFWVMVKSVSTIVETDVVVVSVRVV